MKWFFGIIVSLAVVAVLAVKFYLPNRFHEFVHKEVMKDFAGERSYKVLNSHSHQTIFTSEKKTLTLTSVTGFNPLEYYVTSESKNDQDPPQVIQAKFTYEIIDYADLKVNVAFNDVKNENFSLTNPRLSFTTPLAMGMIKEKDKVLYFATHLKVALLIERLNFSTATSSNELSGLVASFSSKVAGDPDTLTLETSLTVKEIVTVDTKSGTEKLTDAENILTIESFKISGLRALFKEKDKTDPKADVPMAMKMMGLLPKIESIVTLPFKVTLGTNVTHASGKMPMSVEWNIVNANLMQPGAFTIKGELSLPFGLLKDNYEEMISSTFESTQGKNYSHPDFDVSKLTTSDFALAMQFEEGRKTKMINDLKDFFNQKDETNKTKTELILEKSVESGLLKQEGNIYSAQILMENMVITVNGKADFKEELAAALPFAEIDAFLLSRGYVSLKAQAAGPQKNCYMLLPGFPKNNGQMMIKESCVSSCESIQNFCLTNPHEKHLCYLYQCRWEEEVLTFKSSAPVPTEKLVMSKHLEEVKAKLKALERIK